MTPPLVLWTARLAVAAWLARWVVQCCIGRSPRRDTGIRWLWTAAWLVYLVHFLAAFGLVHQWSHAAAIAHTARQTRDVVGLNWGGGLWFNYVFTLVWTIDVARMWATPARLSKPSRLDRVTQVFLTFIVVNATLVFGPRWWWGVFAMVASFAAGIRRSAACSPAE